MSTLSKNGNFHFCPQSASSLLSLPTTLPSFLSRFPSPPKTSSVSSFLSKSLVPAAVPVVPSRSNTNMDSSRKRRTATVANYLTPNATGILLSTIFDLSASVSAQISVSPASMAHGVQLETEVRQNSRHDSYSTQPLSQL